VDKPENQRKMHQLLLACIFVFTYDLFRQQQSGHEHSTPVVVLMDSA